MAEWTDFVGPVVSLVAAGVAWVQARKVLGQGRTAGMFQGFSQANQATLEHPELLYQVHDLDRSVPVDEARAIAYLSVILDAYQHSCDGDYSKLGADSTFLNRVLSVAANRQRWPHVKRIYYAEFDQSFVDAVEEIMISEYTTDGASQLRSS